MRKNFILSAMFIFAIMLTAAFTNNVSAQTTLVNYDFNVLTVTPCSATPVTSTGVTSTFSTIPVNCVSAGGVAATSPPAFTANPTAGTAPSIAGTTSTFQFDLGGASLPSFMNYRLFFQTRSSGTGPNTGVVQCSVNSGAFANCGTFAPVQTAAFVNQSVDLTGVTSLNGANTISFRLIASGGATTGTFRVDNFQVQANAPSAAMVNVGGRVTKSNGRGIFRARVKMTDGSGITRYAVTNSLGYYRFSEVEVGQTLIFDLKHKGYNFMEPTQVVSLSEEMTSVNFTAY